MTRIWPVPKIEFMPLSQHEECRPVALVTDPAVWEAVKDTLRLPIVWRATASKATVSEWEGLCANLASHVGDIKTGALVVYAVGGGVVVDTAKYLAAKQNLPVICLPTCLSVDAFLTWASGVRQEGTVRYLETKPPDRLIVDFDIIAQAPPHIRAAGICDLLSIATGSWDWKFAQEQGMNPPDMQYIPYVAQAAAAILQGALDCAEAAGQGDPAGLKQLLDCLAMEVQLCNQIGHSRPEEGSEHYFAYAIENAIAEKLTHGDLVGPGILLMARLQGQDTAPLEKALAACHIRLDRIPHADVISTLRSLPNYVEHHSFPYSIAHALILGELGRLEKSELL